MYYPGDRETLIYICRNVAIIRNKERGREIITVK